MQSGAYQKDNHNDKSGIVNGICKCIAMEAQAEQWRRRGGGDYPATATINADADAPAFGSADGNGSEGAGAEVARMLKKRQRMEQLIQKSMGMVPKAFEHEAVSIENQHASSSRAASSITSASGTGAAGNISDTSQCEAAPAIGDVEGISDEQHTRQQRPVVARRKQCWTQEEDAKLCSLVKQHGLSHWAVIAAHFPNRDRKRCRERFVNHLDPQLKQQEWTPQEEKQLMDMQREVGNQWAKIARGLPGRSPEDVKNRFLINAAKQLAENAALPSPQPSEKGLSVVVPAARASPKRWSKTEADTLRALVGAHGATNWFFLASQLPGRTDLQCMQQWYQVLDPAVVKGNGTWTAQEDTTLQSKFQELGPKWTQVGQLQTATLAPLSTGGAELAQSNLTILHLIAQISRCLPGRVGKQCRERYLNHLDPSLNKDPWTSEEEAKLVQACEKHASQWFQIAKELPGRSENAIKNHWHTIVRRKILQANTNVGNSSNGSPGDP